MASSNVVRNLFGNQVELPKRYRLVVFHDERYLKPEWLYHGYLFCSEDSIDWLHARLLEIRSNANCERDKSIHFKELRSGSSGSTRTKTAVGWAKFFVNEMYENAWFYLLGINLRNVDYDFFGPVADGGTRDYRIYNKFFEIGLYSACRFFFDVRKDLVEIVRIFSEKRDLPEDDPFLLHAPYRINKRGSNITINCTQVTPLAGGIKREGQFPEHVDVVNLVDVLVGGCSQVFDNPGRKDGCEEVARILVPVCQFFAINPYNPRGENRCYLKKYVASFFPKGGTTLRGLTRGKLPPPNQFYYQRQLKFCQRDQYHFPDF